MVNGGKNSVHCVSNRTFLPQTTIMPCFFVILLRKLFGFGTIFRSLEEGGIMVDSLRA